MTADVRTLAGEVVLGLTAHGLTVAVAESLTGGALTSALVDVPGASVVVRGGVVAYATELKHELLGVDGALLAELGPVSPQVAIMMAAGVRERCSADVGVATTGVAGPDGQDGHSPGEVYVAVVTGADAEVRGLRLTGDRSRVRAQSVAAALTLLIETVGLGVLDMTPDRRGVESE
ncbi:CinA family protein [Amnibacterium flavum]|uniref:Competence protein n=1 Tax=Amnibacterium flavum TaxID=2173173 RepID=A0A2V1HPI5_9MICO|nr:CinA family protein [Amnibacterium flavum]PVZ93522.1 competence protein [Amnibacterium flavum]